MNWLGNFFQKIFPSSQEVEYKAVQESGFVDTTPVVDESFLLDLEESLIRLDCGIEFSEEAVGLLRKQGNLTQYQARKTLSEYFVGILQSVNEFDSGFLSGDGLQIILIVGVNGSGKTTSIGKLAHRFVSGGKKVLIAPCDTFRAAAAPQLTLWAERAGADIHLTDDLKKPDAVLFEALQRASGYDVLLVDTAGRLQNKRDLMDELGRLNKVLDKHRPADSILTRLLVIDATTGQNGFLQAVAFDEVTKLDGLILTKFDSSAKGGILFAITHKLKIPTRFVGVGEKIDQLKDFELEDYIEALKI
ncbi:MAG: signal recognition particle-docking protein FtsY [Candidatus Caenarcaniphilales bacterium]|nr:signal recognition particle-docking protein FtsY [Candidatus Caenarcaniphilales bacterium]